MNKSKLEELQTQLNDITKNVPVVVLECEGCGFIETAELDLSERNPMQDIFDGERWVKIEGEVACKWCYDEWLLDGDYDPRTEAMSAAERNAGL